MPQYKIVTPRGLTSSFMGYDESLPWTKIVPVFHEAHFYRVVEA